MARSTSRQVKTTTLRVLIIPMLLALLCAASIVGGRYAWRYMEEPTSFPISHVIVQGQFARVSQKTLQSAVESQLTGGFFSLNLPAVKQAILHYPWVQSVSFRRIWPNTLRIKVNEQQPLARFDTNGVLTTTGRVIFPEATTIPQSLPLLEGPLDQAVELGHFYASANMLAQALGLTVVMLRVDAEHSWYLQLSNEMLVKLGRQDALSRFKQFVAVYPNIAKTSQKTIVSVDLRYPDGLAVQFMQDSKTPQK
jgi:cell division protein FtsQ